MRGAVARAVRQVQHLSRIRQRHDQRVAASPHSNRLWRAPLAFVIHADACLLLTAGFDQRAVRFNDGLIEKGVGLLPPDFQARFMEGFLQREHVKLRKPTTEISRRGGIGNPLSSQRVEIRLVIPPQFQVLQARATDEQIKRDIEHVIGFAVRQMKPEDRTQPVDAPGEIQLPHKLLHDSDPSRGDGLRAIRQLQLNRRRNQHGRLPVPVGSINPFHHPTLPRLQSIPYTLLHLKTSL